MSGIDLRGVQCITTMHNSRNKVTQILFTRILSENRIDLLLFRDEYFSNEVHADRRTEEWHADSSLWGLPNVCNAELERIINTLSPV